MLISGKRLSKALRLGSGRVNNKPPDLNNECVRYEGVSVSFLYTFYQTVLQGAKATSLVVLLRDTEDLKQGTTVELIRELDNDKIRCSAPYIGLRTLQVKDVKPKACKDWTIEDICEYVILPACLRQSCFYLDLMNEKDIGDLYEGSFVSQARKSNFGDLVKGLVRHFENKKIPLEKAYVWLDIFSANQSKVNNKDRGLPEDVKQKRWDQLTFGLHDAIKYFEDSLIFLNSWTNPYPLQRSWCCWEILGALRSGKPVELVFAPHAMDDFVSRLKSDFHSIMQNLADVDLRKAECHREEDLRMIHKAVNTSVGFDELNSVIVGKLRDWLIETITTAVDKFKAQDASSMSIKEQQDMSRILNQGGRVLKDHCQYEKALETFQASLRIARVAFGNDSTEVAKRLNNIGVVYYLIWKYDDAMKHYEESLEIDSNTIGRDHPDVARTLNNIGLVYKAQGKYDEALKSLTESLQIDRKALGSGDPKVALKLNNIGMVYNSQGKYDEALDHYNEALRINRNALGNDHPNVARTLSNIGNVFRTQQKYDAALKTLSESLQIDRKAFGKDHPNVKATLDDIEDIHHEVTTTRTNS